MRQAKKERDTNYWLEELKKPVEETGALSDAERQRIFNLARNQQVGSQTAQMAGLKEALGSRGFRAGDSGIADTALGNLYRSTQENLAGEAGKIAMDEAARRERLAQLNIARLTGGGDIMAKLRQAAASAAGARTGLKLGEEQLAWEKEKFGQTFPYQKQQDWMNNLFRLWGGMGASQNEVYAPYLNALGQY